MALSKARIILINASKVSLIAPTHSDYDSMAFKISLMCINGVKLMKITD